MTMTMNRLGWVAALGATAWLTACSGGVPPISLVEEDAGTETDARVEPRPDAATPRECESGCLVEGVCHRDGAPNPDNPCEVCDTSVSQSAFTDDDGASCDDGAYCTVGDACSAGVCVGGAARSCDDDLACTSGDWCDESADSCLPGAPSCDVGLTCDRGTGACTTDCRGCAIGGICHADSDRNPANPCEVCRIETSTSAWSPNDGASCDDGAFCTVGDTCTAGSCGGAARDCSDGVACSGAEACNEASDRCVSGASTCPLGSVCVPEADRCEATCTGCTIGGVCFGAGDANPMNPCEICDPVRAGATWSANDGERCDDGLFCTENDACSAGACRGGTRSCDNGVACDGVESCDEAADTCARGVSVCAPGSFCSQATDDCVGSCDGCSIGGSCFADGAENPANGCEICDTSRARGAWSANDGATCEDGSFCSIGDSCLARVCTSGVARECGDGVSCNGRESCDEMGDRCVPGPSGCAENEECDASSDTCIACAGCLIGGVCHADGDVDPSNPCQRCDAAASVTTWSHRDGATCDDGRACTTGDVCVADSCRGAPVVCDDGVACNGLEICDERVARCVTFGPACAAGQVCDVTNDTCGSACEGCRIDDSCYPVGTPNPTDPCLVCGGVGDTDWSADFGATCDDGNACTSGDACAVAGCVGTAVSCSDGVACNGVESCDPASGHCAPGAPTCDAGDTCDPVADACVEGCAGCLLLGVCIPDGDTNPANACEICIVSKSTTAWSANHGVSCDDGFACTSGDTCDGTLCEGQPVVCDDGVACNGLETCDSGLGTCSAGTSTCAGDEVCDESLDRCICDGCVIDGTCYPTGPHPTDVCLECATRGDSAWSPALDGTSCDDGVSCTSGDACKLGVCGGADTCTDGEVCDHASDACEPV